MSGAPLKKDHLKPVAPDGRPGPSRLPDSEFKPEIIVDDESSSPFKSEDQLARAAAARQTLRYTLYIGGVVLVAAAVGLGSWYVFREVRARQGTVTVAAAPLGTAVFKSSPDGAE